MTKIPVLFELMKQKNITAKKLSDDTKISTGNISDWKSGRAKPSLDKIKLLANYFNVTTDYLLGNTDSPDNTFVYDEDDNLVVIDDDTRELIDSLRTRPEMKILFSVSKKATKEDIEQAVKIIEALRKNENEE